MLIKTVKTDAVMNYLKRRFLVNENIMGIIENMPDAEIYVDDIENPKGVLVNKDGYMHYIYTEEDAFIENMCSNYLKEGFFGFSGVEGELAEKIRSRYLVHWESPCTLYYMPKENLDLSLKKTPTQPIGLEDAETVDEFYRYRGPGTLDTIRRDITKRSSSAVYINGDIACWVLIHDDNSMGIMYTKEEHRRKGYAVDVTIDLAHQIIEAGRIPFIQIVKGNSMSPGLAEKCGFVEAGKADWFGIILGTPKELIDANDRNRKAFLENVPEPLRRIIYDKAKVYKGLYNVLCSFKYEPAESLSVSLVKVENDKQKKAWCEITSHSLQGSIDKAAQKDALCTLLDNPDMSMYVLYKGDIAVGASTTYIHEEDRGLYLLSVLPQYQNSGLLKALVNETIQTEKANGCEFLVAQAEQSTVKLYKELYFWESHEVQP